MLISRDIIDLGKNNKIKIICILHIVLLASAWGINIKVHSSKNEKNP